jgi:uncharacterized protein (TIGR03083 family)
VIPPNTVHGIAYLDDEDRALRAVALASADMEAAVPSCPGWTGRDLLRHVGVTPHGLAVCISTPIGSLPDMRKVKEGYKNAPADDESLIEWACGEIKGWAEHLRHLDPSAPAFSMTADKTLGYWMRHAAIETAVHLWDVEGISESRSGIRSDLAADGLDELLLFVDYRRFRKDPLPVRSLRVTPNDTQQTRIFPGTDDPGSTPDEVRGEPNSSCCACTDAKPVAPLERWTRSKPGPRFPRSNDHDLTLTVVIVRGWGCLDLAGADGPVGTMSNTGNAPTTSEGNTHERTYPAVHMMQVSEDSDSGSEKR